MKLQWVHGLSTVGDIPPGLATHPLNLLLQWVHGLSTVGDQRGWRALYLATDASMGPRPFDRGRQSSTRAAADSRTLLQWVHGLSTVGDLTMALTNVASGATLQWVHGLSTVGDARGICCNTGHDAASMGPRPSDRGRPVIRQVNCVAVKSFNGSTAF